MVISNLTSRTSFERLALGSIRFLEASGKATKEWGTRELWSLSSMPRLKRSSSMPHILRLLAETLRKPFVCRMHLNTCWIPLKPSCRTHAEDVAAKAFSSDQHRNG